MIDLGYSMIKDAFNIIAKQKKKYDKDGYIELLEKQITEQAEKYDELIEEYKKLNQKTNSDNELGRIHCEILIEIEKREPIECKGYLEYLRTKNIDYEIALELLVRKKYILKCIISDRDATICFYNEDYEDILDYHDYGCFIINSECKLEVLKLIKEYDL